MGHSRSLVGLAEHLLHDLARRFRKFCSRQWLNVGLRWDCVYARNNRAIRTRAGAQTGKHGASRLIVCFEIESRNSSHTHCIRSTMRQRTTPCTTGIGPASTIRRSAMRWGSRRSGRLPGALPFTSPAGPSALNWSTQSRTVCSPTPPIAAAALREPRHRPPPRPTIAGVDPHRLTLWPAGAATWRRNRLEAELERPWETSSRLP